MNVLDDESQSSRTAVFSFFGAAGACILLVVCWWLMRPPRPILPRQRQLSDVDVRWRCPNGHVFTRKGAVRSIQCQQCNRNADIEITFVCPEHGDQTALVRYMQSPDGGEHVAAVSFRPLVWTDVTDAVKCPECARSLKPRVTIPFDRTHPSNRTHQPPASP